MNEKKTIDKSLRVVTSPITELLVGSSVLPGESEIEYQQGLIATIQELGATTPLQIYLVEKIYECLWWMRRYENQKRATIIRNMASALDPDNLQLAISELEACVMEVLFANGVDDEFHDLLKEHNLTLDSLKQKAFAESRQALENLDQMIALKAKTLAGFQASYEVLVNRKINIERMRLQNALMQRDLGAIQYAVVDDQANKPQKAPSK
jgi:hypothetical protein